jgi:hypothetical protein
MYVKFNGLATLISGTGRDITITHTHVANSHVYYIQNMVPLWMGRECRVHSEARNPYKILVGKPQGKRQCGRPRRKWEENIKTDLKEIE